LFASYGKVLTSQGLIEKSKSAARVETRRWYSKKSAGSRLGELARISLVQPVWVERGFNPVSLSV
jgi:hypothetical protein